MLAAAAAAGLVYLWSADPHDPSVPMPLCPTKLVTGLDCPGCGGLRMTHDLLHGRLGDAVHDNLFLLVALPVGAVFAWRWWRGRTRGAPVRVRRGPALAILAVAVVFTVVRNLPGSPLAPH